MRTFLHAKCGRSPEIFDHPRQLGNRNIKNRNVNNTLGLVMVEIMVKGTVIVR